MSYLIKTYQGNIIESMAAFYLRSWPKEMRIMVQPTLFLHESAIRHEDKANEPIITRVLRPVAIAFSAATLIAFVEVNADQISATGLFAPFAKQTSKEIKNPVHAGRCREIRKQWGALQGLAMSPSSTSAKWTAFARIPH